VAKKVFYKQCTLCRGSKSTTSWLPEKFAVHHKYLKLKNADGTWENGWRVMSIGSQRWDESYLNERSQDYRHQREASDI
jgi:hypothetical protein